MLRALSLLPPALIPSWRFFDEIRPSPRIEYALLERPGQMPPDWLEFRPRPERLTPSQIATRLLWNPQWNEGLFLVSCAERVIALESEHARDEIFARLMSASKGEKGWLIFRLSFVYREGGRLQKEILYTSPARRLECSDEL